MGSRLEIREKGIWYSPDDLVWEDIINYSWSENKQSDLLLIRHINGYNNKIESKYPVETGEREKIDKILQNKIKNN